MSRVTALVVCLVLCTGCTTIDLEVGAGKNDRFNFACHCHSFQGEFEALRLDIRIANLTNGLPGLESKGSFQFVVW